LPGNEKKSNEVMHAIMKCKKVALEVKKFFG
jgi:hypothetical protein